MLRSNLSARATFAGSLFQPRNIAILAAAVLATSRPAAAGGDVFHLFAPTTEAGHLEVETLNAFHRGLSGTDDHGVRNAHELALSYGVSEYLLLHAGLGFSRHDGEHLRTTSLELASVLRLPVFPSAGHVQAGWFTGLKIGLDDEETNALTFGPTLAFARGPFSVLINPFLEKTFGDNREPGIAFSYGWRATLELTDALHIGVEAFGEVENLSDPPAWRDQVHRIGPVVYFGHLHGAPRAPHQHKGEAHGGHHHHAAESASSHEPEWHAAVGVLFGATAATPDAAIKLDVGVGF